MPDPNVLPAASNNSIAPVEQKPTEATDPAIEALKLSAVARMAAYVLKKKHPGIIFTSGRRDRAAQAHAMAANVVLNRKWIRETYLPSPACLQCQDWLDRNPEKITREEIAGGLDGVLAALSDADLARFSKHLSGDAFDVQPVKADADEIKQTLNSLPGKSKFLEREGGLLRWHVQF